MSERDDQAIIDLFSLISCFLSRLVLFQVKEPSAFFQINEFPFHGPQLSWSTKQVRIQAESALHHCGATVAPNSLKQRGGLFSFCDRREMRANRPFQKSKDPRRYVLLAIAKRLRKLKDLTTAAQGSLGSFVTASTFDSLDRSQDILTGNVRDQAITKEREKVVFKSSPNALCMIRGFTAQRKDLRQPFVGYNAKCIDSDLLTRSTCFFARCAGINILVEFTLALVPLFPRFLQRDLRVHAERDFALFALKSIAKMPPFAAIGIHDQGQSTAVGQFVVFIDRNRRGRCFGGTAGSADHLQRFESALCAFHIRVGKNILYDHAGNSPGQ